MADFPDVFVKSMLIGGVDDLKALISSDEFKQILAPEIAKTRKGRVQKEPNPLGCFLRYGKRHDGKPPVKCERKCGPWSLIRLLHRESRLGHGEILRLIFGVVN
jgi:hypothetical protein